MLGLPASCRPSGSLPSLKPCIRPFAVRTMLSTSLLSRSGPATRMLALRSSSGSRATLCAGSVGAGTRRGII
eukprot:2665178-Alexandrium_andersonii.AAC.1